MNDLVNQVRLNGYGDYYGFNIDFDDTEIHEKYNMFSGDQRQRVSNFARFQRYFILYILCCCLFGIDAFGLNSINRWYSMSFARKRH